MGCQKYGSNRPKRFLEKFIFNNIEYKHKYIEEFRNDEMKKLAILYESLISFVSGCSYIQSLVKPKIYNNYSTNNHLDDVSIDRCMKMLKEKMSYCPFSISSVDEEKRIIYLKRESPSHCPICKKREPHESRDPLIYITKGKVYWNCLRHDKGVPNLYLGDLSMNILELLSLTTVNNTEIIESDNDYEYQDDEIQCYKIPKLNESETIQINTNETNETNELKIVNEPNKINITENVNELLLKTIKESSINKLNKNKNKLEDCENVILNSILLRCNNIK
jgi:hypothetical protein